MIPLVSLMYVEASTFKFMCTNGINDGGLSVVISFPETGCAKKARVANAATVRKAEWRNILRKLLESMRHLVEKWYELLKMRLVDWISQR